MAIHTPNASSVAPAPAASSPVTIQDSDDDIDEDNAFIRNRNPQVRSQKIASILKTSKQVEIISSDDDTASGNGESDGTPKRSRKKGKNKLKQQQQQSVSVFKKRRPMARLATTSDEDDVVVLKDINGARGSARTASASKKRNRSGSESSGSLTPPPELTAEERARARAVVETTLQIPPAKKQKTPPIDDDLFDFADSSADLNPELRQIAERVRAGAVYQKSSRNVPGRNSESICVNVRWISHPAHYDGLARRTWSVVISRGDTFAQSLLPKLVEDTGAQDIVLRYEDKRIFRTSTPYSLDLWGEIELSACTPATLDYLVKPHEEAAPSSSPIERAASEALSEASVDDDVDESFQVILRAKDQKDVTLKVKPTATAAKVLAAYLKKIPAAASMSTARKQKVHLFFDGEKVNSNTSLAELDVEDDDVLDVMGL